MHPDTVAVYCQECRSKLITLPAHDQEYDRVRKEGMQCPKCKEVKPIVGVHNKRVTFLDNS
jgi:hypothetical protein